MRISFSKDQSWNRSHRLILRKVVNRVISQFAKQKIMKIHAILVDFHDNLLNEKRLR